MTASIDGQVWPMDTLFTRVIRDGNQFFIEGHRPDGNRLEVYVANAAIGTHIATGRSTGQIATCYVRYTPPGANTFYSSFMPVTNAGQVNITEIDLTHKTISGTFSGNLTMFNTSVGVVKVTNGVFTKMKYEDGNLITLIDEAPQNLAFAKVDGNLRMFTFDYESVGFSIRLWGSDGADNLELNIPENTGIGDHMLGPYNSSDAYTMRMAGEESISGTLSITRIGDGRIEATFTFTTSSMTVTNGVLGHTF